MIGLNVEKIELTCHIVRTHNRIELPKFKLAHLFGWAFCRINAGFAAFKRAKPLDLAQDMAGGTAIWHGSVRLRSLKSGGASRATHLLAVGTKRLDQGDLAMNICI